ncbi:5'-nucleotidase [Nymphaea thermarum]|nr:5'-nucleotidase [Nymphaea thermarum]
MEETKSRPLILVTNDDGIFAPGLRALVHALVSTGRYHVNVCAPDSEMSAVGHAVTVRDALRVIPVQIEGATAYAVSGLLIFSTMLGDRGESQMKHSSSREDLPEEIALVIIIPRGLARLSRHKSFGTRKIQKSAVPRQSLRIENMWRPNTRDDDSMKRSLSQSRTTVGKVTASAMAEGRRMKGKYDKH